MHQAKNVSHIMVVADFSRPVLSMRPLVGEKGGDVLA